MNDLVEKYKHILKRPYVFREPSKVLSAIESIDSVIQLTDDVDDVLNRVMDLVLDIFMTSRAWLFYPCNPELPSFNVTVESTVPDYPGAKHSGQAVPMTDDMAKYCRRALATQDSPAIDPPTGEPVTNDIAIRFGVKSMLFMALRPKTGEAWMFGLHQCDRNRTWSADEKQLFHMIGQRISGCIDNMLYVHQLRESEERYRSLVMQSSDCLVLHDFNGDILDVNNLACTTYGYSRDELLSMKVSDLDPDYNYRSDNGAFYDKLIPGTPFIFRARQRCKDGREFPVEVRLSLINFKGKILIQGLCRDISEKIRVEEQLRQAQRIESIGNLAGGIAHDFNNILSSILGFTELAMDEAPESTFLEENLNEVYSAGKRARDLVQQILTFARQSDEKKSPIQPRVIIQEVLKFIRSTIPSTIEIQQNIESLSWIEGNSTQMHQVLMNLCTNAAQAMEDNGGTLKVSLKDLTVTNLKNKHDIEPGNWVELTVSDTGTGIPAEIIGSIFEPYFTTKKPGKGTGMGLALAHGVVESYGGKISVVSEPGLATTFTIVLPTTAKRSENTDSISDELPGGNEHILLVDDEVTITRISSRILQKLGYKVTFLDNSIKALEQFKANPSKYDLVITDMTMPFLTGDKLAIEMLKIRHDIPVILHTGYSKRITEEFAREIGIKAFAFKPVTKVELAKTVRRVLDESRSLDNAECGGFQ